MPHGPLFDEFSSSIRNTQKLAWHCAVNNWAVNSAVNESRFSPSQWVLGRGLRLPYNMLSQTGSLDLQTRHVTDKPFSERVAMLASAQRAHLALRYSRSLSHAITARHRGGPALPAQARFQLGDQVYYWRGTTKIRPNGLSSGMYPLWSLGSKRTTCGFSTGEPL